MPHRVRIERVGPDGSPLGQAAVVSVCSENDAIMVMRCAMTLSRNLAELTRISVYGPGYQLITTCRSDEDQNGIEGATPNANAASPDATSYRPS